MSRVSRRARALLASISATLGACTTPVDGASSPPTVVIRPEPAPSAPPSAGPSARPSTPPSGASLPDVVDLQPPPPPAPTPSAPVPDSTFDSVEGRPFLVEGRPRVAAVARGGGWSSADGLDVEGLDEATREALAAHFVEWARGEHASIASFGRFALQLLALGAPAELIDRALEAARDEVRHAAIGFAFVEALTGEPHAPSPLPTHDALPPCDLAGVLRLVVREGCLGETLAALELEVAADEIVDDGMRATIRGVGADETRHAELSWAFAAWALRAEPSLRAIVAEEVAGWRSPPLRGREGLRRFGVLPAAERRVLFERGYVELVRPLAERLLAVA